MPYIVVLRMNSYISYTTIGSYNSKMMESKLECVDVRISALKSYCIMLCMTLCMKLCMT